MIDLGRKTTGEKASSNSNTKSHHLHQTKGNGFAAKTEMATLIRFDSVIGIDSAIFHSIFIWCSLSFCTAHINITANWFAARAMVYKRSHSDWFQLRERERSYASIASEEALEPVQKFAFNFWLSLGFGFVRAADYLVAVAPLLNRRASPLLPVPEPTL